MNKPPILRHTRCLLLCGLVLAPCQAVVAASAENRACNLQGREIALRVSEEVSGDLSAGERNRIAAIAEEVCAEYARDVPAPAPAAVPVVSRPAAPQPAAQAVEAPPDPEAAPAAEAAEADEEEGGLFNLRVIDPEDRVQRPGLKRR